MNCHNCVVFYSEYCQDGYSIEGNQHAVYAEDPVHAINQLLDFYKDCASRVDCIESVVFNEKEGCDE